MPEEVVGWLMIQGSAADTISERTQICDESITHMDTDVHGCIEVCGNEQFILGRDPELW